MIECLDVRDLPGRWKIQPTEDHIPGSRIDPWNLEILCRHGSIYPHGGTRLQTWCTGRIIRYRLRGPRGVTVHQWGDEEATFVFEQELFPAVARLMGARRKRPGPPNPSFSRRAPGTGQENDPKTDDRAGGR